MLMQCKILANPFALSFRSPAGKLLLIVYVSVSHMDTAGGHLPLLDALLQHRTKKGICRKSDSLKGTPPGTGRHRQSLVLRKWEWFYAAADQWLWHPLPPQLSRSECTGYLGTRGKIAPSIALLELDWPPARLSSNLCHRSTPQNEENCCK